VLQGLNRFVVTTVALALAAVVAFVLVSQLVGAVHECDAREFVQNKAENFAMTCCALQPSSSEASRRACAEALICSDVGAAGVSLPVGQQDGTGDGGPQHQCCGGDFPPDRHGR
jgi:hypothetical protein